MRHLILALSVLALSVLWPALAIAQAPATAAPAIAPAATPSPTFHTVPLDIIRAACTKEQGCGCSKGVDACVQMFVDAKLPTATLACVAHQPCAVMCESEDAGLPGTKLHTACLAPEAQKAAASHFIDNTRVAACAAHRRCGCETRDPKTCAASLAKTAPDVSGGFWACVANQPCADICDPNTHKPGGGIHTRCMLPSTAKLRALTAQTTQLMINLSSKMQRQMHQTTMGIIRNMAPTPTRIDVYDAQGNYLRSE